MKDKITTLHPQGKNGVNISKIKYEVMKMNVAMGNHDPQRRMSNGQRGGTPGTTFSGEDYPRR